VLNRSIGNLPTISDIDHRQMRAVQLQLFYDLVSAVRRELKDLQLLKMLHTFQ
jgi:hypothetical protein